MNSELLKQNLRVEAGKFTPISLSEMNGVSLMDRFDVKYLVPVHLLSAILRDALPYYRVLEIDGERLFSYDTLYYDTPDLHLYNSHHSGKGNRYKIRFRNYVESDLSFFEIKHRNNKGKTCKSRIALPTAFNTSLTRPMSDFLARFTPLSSGDMLSSLRVQYQRLTLVNRQKQERVTIDINLSFEHEAQRAAFPHMAVFEIKQERLRGSDMSEILKKYHVRPGSISKYCLGIISTHEQIKFNRFKGKFLQIIKLNNQYDLSSNVSFGGTLRVV